MVIFFKSKSADVHSSQYKGVHFSKYSSKRSSSFGAKPGPGPGDYDTVEPVQVDVEHYHMKNLSDKKPELNIPRYPEMILKNIEKEVSKRKITKRILVFLFMIFSIKECTRTWKV